jgi:hypothetical protein
LESRGTADGSRLTVNILRPTKPETIMVEPILNSLVAYAQRAKTKSEKTNCETRLQNIHLGKLDWRYLSGNELKFCIVS